MTGKLPAYGTTGKRPAFRLVSRLYRIGYNALAVLVLPLLLPSLDPLWSYLPCEVKRSGQGFIAIQLLRCFVL